MSAAVKLSDDLVNQARTRARALNRSTAGQIEYWSKIGKLTEENPELHYELIRNILISLEEAKSGDVEPYEFE